MGKVVYVLTWPLSAILLRVFQGPKEVREAKAAQARAYLRHRTN
jgi:hypothetical protein